MSHSKDYDSTYIAEVVDVQDPEKRCRVRVNVFELFDNVPVDDLPWANFVLPLGSRPDEGALTPVQVGDLVWVEFIGGDTRRPLIIGAAQAAPGGEVNLAAESYAGADQYEHKRTENQPQVEEASYYEDAVYRQNNTLIQICRKGNIRVTQMGSGSAVEITPKGHMVLHCEGDMFVSVEGKTLYEYNDDVTQIYHKDLETIIMGRAGSLTMGGSKNVISPYGQECINKRGW